MLGHNFSSHDGDVRCLRCDERPGTPVPCMQRVRRMRQDWMTDEEIADNLACWADEEAALAALDHTTHPDRTGLSFDEHTHIGGLSPNEQAER